jgi:hypothetical protein
VNKENTWDAAVWKPDEVKEDNFKTDLKKMCRNNVKFIEVAQAPVHCQYLISTALNLLVLLSQLLSQPA